MVCICCVISCGSWKEMVFRFHEAFWGVIRYCEELFIVLEGTMDKGTKGGIMFNPGDHNRN